MTQRVRRKRKVSTGKPYATDTAVSLEKERKKRRRRRSTNRPSENEPVKRRRRKKRRSSPTPILVENKKSYTGSIFLLLTMIVLFVLTLVLYLKFDRAEIVSGSMEPTLMTDDRVIVINDRQPKRFDLVVFHPPTNTKEKYVKRLIGMPGDELFYRNDVLYINNQYYNEPYLDGYKVKYRLAQGDETDYENYTEDFTLEDLPNVPSGTVKIPKGMYLMLGDNRRESQDSRYIGLIPEENFEGIVWKRYYRAGDEN